MTVEAQIAVQAALALLRQRGVCDVEAIRTVLDAYGGKVG